MIRCLLFVVWLVAPVWAAGTWNAPAQTVTKIDCAPGTSCTIPIAATAAGNPAVIVHYGYSTAGVNNLSVITSVTGCGAWALSKGAASFDSGFTTGVSLDFAYILSLPAGCTSLTVNYPNQGNGSYLFFKEGSCTGCTITFDTASPLRGYIDAGGTILNPVGVGLALHGNNDWVIEAVNSEAAAGCTAISSPYTGTFAGLEGIADRRNTNSGAAPTWTCASGAVARIAIAFSSDVLPAFNQIGSAIGGNARLGGSASLGSFLSLQDGFEQLTLATGADTGSPITVTIPGNTFTTGQRLFCIGFKGQTGANGFWNNVTVSGSSVTLTGSVSAGTYTSGGGCQLASSSPWQEIGDTSNTGITINTNSSFTRGGNRSIEFDYSIINSAGAQDHNMYLAHRWDELGDSDYALRGGMSHFWVRGYVYIETPTQQNAAVQRKLWYFKDPPDPAQIAPYQWAILLTTDDTGIGTPMALRWNLFHPITANNVCQKNIGGFTSVTTGIDRNVYPDGPGSGLNHNQWYCVEGEVQLNTPGFSDGEVRTWVDGVQYLDARGLDIRSACTTGVTSAEIGRQVNVVGANQSIVERRWWKPVTISTQRIRCGP